MLTTATRREDAFTAENVLNDYVRRGYERSSKHVFLVHRLDRETSGVLVFAKSQDRLAPDENRDDLRESLKQHVQRREKT